MTDSDTEGDKRSTTVWGIAVLVAALGAWIMYDALPGINWLVWTMCASAGLLVFVRSVLPGTSLVTWLVIFAVVIAGGAAFTADQFLHGLICLSVIMLLALAMLLSVDARVERLTAVFAIVAPVVAFGLALSESLHRLTAALHLVRSSRARAVLRGLAITAPVLLVFGLLLSTADPTFAGWRDAIQDLLASWAFIPRTIFFLGLLAVTLGAFGHASRGATHEPYGIAYPVRSSSSEPDRWLGATEHLILMASVSLLFWVFLAVQISYLFGNLPSITGSGMTFAEYARRGFAELSVVASATALLIIVAQRYGKTDRRHQLLRGVTLSVIVGVLFLLTSAFHRVSLYEEAYGFTTARLYAQAYMIIVAISLVALAREVTAELNVPRLFRTAGVTAILAFIGLIYWNHESWIAERNVDLFASTGKLDVVYLTRDLSADAIPTIVSRLPTLPEPAKSQLSAALALRYPHPHADRWFEWNLGRTRARKALGSL
ncbi:MAG: DUF4173 domain-containing protein [Gemmatimonadaceae bacterium]